MSDWHKEHSALLALLAERDDQISEMLRDADMKQEIIDTQAKQIGALRKTIAAMIDRAS